MKECRTTGNWCTTLTFVFGMIVGSIVQTEVSPIRMVGYMMVSGFLFYCAYSLSYINLWNRLLGTKVTKQL
jgi:hypothetical protein